MKRFSISKNQTILLNKNRSITFTGHSHKRTLANGPGSPLIIHMEYHLNGDSSNEEYRLNLNNHPDSEAGWEWNTYKFILHEYAYNDYMVLSAVEI